MANPFVWVELHTGDAEKAKSLGATVKEENVPIPGAGRFSIVVDPTGAEVALWENAQH